MTRNSRPQTIKPKFRPINPGSAIVPVPPRRNMGHHVLIGIACGLGLLTVFGILLLFQRGTSEPLQASPAAPTAAQPATASTPSAIPSTPSLPAPPPPSAVAASPAPAPAPASSNVRKSPRIVKPAQARSVTPAPFRGTVRELDGSQVSAQTASSQNAEPATPAAVAASAEAPDADPADAKKAGADAANEEVGAPDQHSSGRRIKRMFGTLMRPFSRKKSSRPANAVAPQNQ